MTVFSREYVCRTFCPFTNSHKWVQFSLHIVQLISTKQFSLANQVEPQDDSNRSLGWL